MTMPGQPAVSTLPSDGADRTPLAGTTPRRKWRKPDHQEAYAPKPNCLRLSTSADAQTAVPKGGQDDDPRAGYVVTAPRRQGKFHRCSCHETPANDDNARMLHEISQLLTPASHSAPGVGGSPALVRNILLDVVTLTLATAEQEGNATDTYRAVRDALVSIWDNPDPRTDVSPPLVSPKRRDDTTPLTPRTAGRGLGATGAVQIPDEMWTRHAPTNWAWVAASTPPVAAGRSSYSYQQPWLMLPLLVPRMVACRTTLTTIGKSREDDEVHIVWTVGFGALAMSLRASFTSPNILLMTVLSQGMRSLNPFQNLKPSLLQSLPQRASMCNCSR